MTVNVVSLISAQKKMRPARSMSGADVEKLVGRGERKLTAVLYADMVGYSRLIGVDDIGTIRRLRALRSSLIDPAIDQHGGQIVQTAGDSLLVAFDSIYGALSCAVAVQQAVPSYDGVHPADRAIRFRMGLNIGDVIADGTDLHGDVVNVAARLQAECPPGAICVTRAVRDHVRGQLDLSFEPLGALNLKNIARAIEGFVIRPASGNLSLARVQQPATDDRQVLIFAGYAIDLHGRELRRAGQIIPVEPQVYELLVHLLQNRSRVVSKDELFDAVWDGRIVSKATLSSRINAARKAIGDDGDRQALIKTIYRRGFRFIGAVQEASPPLDPIVRSTEPAPASRKPSVAVLPFTNLSREPDSDYFSYGLTEDIIRLLARNRWLDVLSRHSAVCFQDRSTDPRAIGIALGIRYLVQGTVAKHAAQVRIAADLVSAETGHHLWSESYDAALTHILDVQRSMAQQIAAVIEPELARLEREAAVRRPPVNLDAWDCYQRGLYYLWGFTTPGLAEGEAMFRRAIELDPSFARAHGGLAYVKLQALVMRGVHERPALLEDALHDARSAVSLDGQDCMNLCVVGRILCFMHQFDEAVAYLEEAIRINPSFAQAYFALGFTLIVCGRAADAMPYLARAVQLSPHDPHLSSIYAIRALGHLALSEPHRAESFARKATLTSNVNRWPFLVLASLHGLMGHIEDARRALDTVLDSSPSGFSMMDARSEIFFCGDQALMQRYLEGLRLAGLPESTVIRRRRTGGPLAAPGV